MCTVYPKLIKKFHPRFLDICVFKNIFRYFIGTYWAANIGGQEECVSGFFITKKRVFFFKIALIFNNFVIYDPWKES